MEAHDMQPLVRLEQDSTNDGKAYEFIQHQSAWFPTNGFTYAALAIQVLDMDANRTFLFIETSDSVDGPWETAATYRNNGGSILSADAIDLVLSRNAPYGTDVRLRNFIRWRVYMDQGNAGLGYCSFRIRIILKA